MTTHIDTQAPPRLVRYGRNDEVHLAFEVIGEGPIDLAGPWS